MENIRCCVLNKKSFYRGIDREVDMRIFNGFNNKKSIDIYNKLYDWYLLYLSTEEKYTPENLNILFSFSHLINQHNENSEVILYATTPVNSDALYRFLGIDVIDTHLKSILKNAKKFKNKILPINQYGLLDNNADAVNFIQHLKEKDERNKELYQVYVYCIPNHIQSADRELKQ